MAVTSANVSGTFKTVTSIYGNVSGNWKSVDVGYANVSGTWQTVYVAFQPTSFVTLTGGNSTTITVPQGANAIHVQAAVGGGGGAIQGCDYDKAGGEQGGPGGGSGAYVSDKIFQVTAGEILTLNAGSYGAASNPGGSGKFNCAGSSGNNTTLSGSITGTIFTLNGGGGSSRYGGGVKGPLGTMTAGTAGTATFTGSVFTSGVFNQSGSVVSVTTCTGGPVHVFNSGGDGAAGINNGNCGGDNCNIAGGDGGASYNGNISGGTGGTPSGTSGTRGSGGGGGGRYGSEGGGGNGGDGEFTYRFLRVAS
jgi:hypothetical protein